MDDLQVTSVLSLFDTNKEQRKTFVEAVINRVERGTSNPLTVHVQLKCMEDIIKKILDDRRYKDLVIDEAGKYSGKTFEYGNADISVKETGVVYDFTMCNDPRYDELAKEFEESKERLDARKKFLKSLPLAGIDILQEGGEVVKAYPPSKTSTTSPVVSLK